MLDYLSTAQTDARSIWSKGFMFSLVGFHVFPTRVACFPSTGFMFSLFVIGFLQNLRLQNRGFHVFPRGVSCFPYQGFMFSLGEFHVFPAFLMLLLHFCKIETSTPTGVHFPTQLAFLQIGRPHWDEHIFPKVRLRGSCPAAVRQSIRNCLYKVPHGVNEASSNHPGTRNEHFYVLFVPWHTMVKCKALSKCETPGIT